MRARQPVDMKDLVPYATDRRIRGLSHDGRILQVSWDDGRVSHLPAIWLRDNCACVSCRHPATMERLFKFIDHAGPIEIASANIGGDSNLTVQFGRNAASSHTSCYDAAWLRHHGLNSDARPVADRAIRLLSAADLKTIPAFRHAEVMRDPGALIRWLESLLSTGVTLVEGVPAELGAVRRLAERVGPLRVTNFGTVFQVESKPNPNNAAYTPIGLEPHTDIPNVPHPPGVQLLNFIRNDAVGGESILVDGFRVAAELRRQNPASFDLLASESIEFRFHDAEVDLRHRAPVISLDAANGQLREIRFNNWIRATLDLPTEKIDAYYAALGHFWHLLRDTRFVVRPRFSSGQTLVFDNRRILHGREPFDPSTGVRLLQGCYLDMESVASRLRLLQRSA